MIAFLLFVLLGFACFVPLSSTGRLIVMIIYLLLMVLIALGGLGVVNSPMIGGTWFR